MANHNFWTVVILLIAGTVSLKHMGDYRYGNHVFCGLMVVTFIRLVQLEYEFSKSESAGRRDLTRAVEHPCRGLSAKVEPRLARVSPPVEGARSKSLCGRVEMDTGRENDPVRAREQYSPRGLRVDLRGLSEAVGGNDSSLCGGIEFGAGTGEGGLTPDTSVQSCANTSLEEPANTLEHAHGPRKRAAQAPSRPRPSPLVGNLRFVASTCQLKGLEMEPTYSDAANAICLILACTEGVLEMPQWKELACLSEGQKLQTYCDSFQKAFAVIEALEKSLGSGKGRLEPGSTRALVMDPARRLGEICTELAAKLHAYAG